MADPATTALMGTDGREITERDLRRGTRLNYIAGSLAMVWAAAAMGIPLTLMLQVLGASGVLIGLTTTVQQVAMVVQIPVSFIAEQFKTRKGFWAWVVIPHRAIWLVPAALPLLLPGRDQLIAVLIVVVVAISSLLAQAGTASWYSWMADLIPESQASRFWGRRQSILMAVSLVAVMAVGWILDLFPDPRTPGGSFTGYAIVFGIAAVAGVVDIIIHLGVPEPRPRPAPQEHGLVERILAPLRLADFRWLSLALGVWTFGVGLVGTFGIIYLRRDFGVTYLQLSALNIAASLGAILAGVQSGYVIDRLGARTYGVVLFLVTPLLGLCWFFVRNEPVPFRLPLFGEFALPQPVVLLCVVNLAAGALYGSIGLVQLRLLAATTPQTGRTVAMAVHWTIIGVTGALGPLLGGVIMDWFDARQFDVTLLFGTKLSFFQALVVMQMLLAWLAGIPLLRRIKVRKGDIPVGTALPRLWMGNPLRAVRNTYSIYTVNAAVSMARRAEAVRELGQSRTVLAVSDLIAQLDDAAWEVREAAVRALGKLDSPEAVVGLIVKLESPECDLGPQIARALRHAHSPLAIDALLRRLDDPDRETQVEAARALGIQRDRRAVEPLLALLARTSDPKVFAAAATALGQLQDPRALGLLLPAMRTTPSALLRKTLRLAVGDILGEPGELYEILATEQQARGSGLERLLAAVRDRVADGALPAPDPLGGLQTAYEKQELARCATLLAALGRALQRSQPGWPAATTELLESFSVPWPGLDAADIILGAYALKMATGKDRA